MDIQAVAGSKGYANTVLNSLNKHSIGKIVQRKIWRKNAYGYVSLTFFPIREVVVEEALQYFKDLKVRDIRRHTQVSCDRKIEIFERLKLEMTEEQAIKIHYLIFTICKDMGDGRKPVAKLASQIKKSLYKQDVKRVGGQLITSWSFKKPQYESYINGAADDYDAVKKRVIKKGGDLDVFASELLQNLYCVFEYSSYGEIFYKKKLIMNAINSFVQCCKATDRVTDENKLLDYTKNAWMITDEYLKEIGYESPAKGALHTLKNIVKGNLILEGKVK